MKLPEIDMDILEDAYTAAVLSKAREQGGEVDERGLASKASTALHAWLDDVKEEAQERGYAGGHHDGLADGYSNGHDEGSDVGYEIGYEAGYEAGLEDGGGE